MVNQTNSQELLLHLKKIPIFRALKHLIYWEMSHLKFKKFSVTFYSESIRLYNFFVPQLKLIEKVRGRLKNRQKYDQPKTPYQRLLESPHLTMAQKEDLRRKYQLLNPIELREIIKRQTLKLNRSKQGIKELKLAAVLY